MAEQGDPSLVAIEDEKVVSYIMWGDIGVPMDSKWKTCHALGSYTLADYRHHGIVTALRHRGLEMAIERGYERIIGPMHIVNRKGIHEMEKEGAIPTVIQMERFI